MFTSFFSRSTSATIGDCANSDNGDSNTIKSRIKKRPFFIVSLDGGGVRGALQTEILGRLFEMYPTLEQRVDMYAGSSVGAFLAAGLATRCYEQAQQCCTEQQFAQIFKQTWCHEAASADGWYEAQYETAPVAQFCDNFFAQKTFADTNKHLLVTSFRVEETSDDESNLDSLCAHYFPQNRWQPVIYHNLDSNNKQQLCTRIADALMQSSAAPAYFPVHKKCVDGGLLANNPSMLAVAYAMRFGLVQSLDDIFLLSLGTGKAPHTLSSYGENANLGRGEWLPQITDLLMQSNSECAVIECASLLGKERFCRVQPVLQQPIALDDYRKVALLKKIAKDVDLSEAQQWIENNKHLLN